MKNQFFHVVTDLGDTAVILPLTALLAGLLWRYESRRAAWLLLRAMLVCLLVMAALKMLFLSCGYASGIGIASPSGHTSIAIFFYGALAALVWARRQGALRYAALLLAIFVVAAVAASRVALGFHSLQEVLCGMLVGALCLMWFARPYFEMQHSNIQLQSITLALLPVLLLTYGMVLPVESMLRNLTPYFRAVVCPA